MLASFARRFPRPVVHSLSSTCTRALSISSRKRILFPAVLRTRHVRRRFSVTPPAGPASSLSTEEYASISDRTMDGLLDRLETLVDSHGESGWEVEYHSGVMNLNLGTHGIYVINKQPPNKQIWLSSPFSGPKRFDWNPEAEVWIYSRDGTSLRTLLSTELADVFSLPASDVLGEGKFFGTE